LPPWYLRYFDGKYGGSVGACGVDQPDPEGYRVSSQPVLSFSISRAYDMQFILFPGKKGCKNLTEEKEDDVLKNPGRWKSQVSSTVEANGSQVDGGG
jgi:hypothetical protein